MTTLGNDQFDTPIEEDGQNQTPEDNDLTEEDLMKYLEGDDLEYNDSVQDGTHDQFANLVNDQLLQLAEGYADPTPSVLLDDLHDTDHTSTAENSSNQKLQHILKLDHKENMDPSVASSKRSALPAWMEEVQKEQKSANETFEEKLSNYSENKKNSRYSGSKHNGSASQASNLPAWMMEASQEDLEQAMEPEIVYDRNSIGSGSIPSGSWKMQQSIGSASKKSYKNSFHPSQSQKSEDSSRWTQNRSYYLRMQKQKENSKGDRDWTKGLTKSVPPKQTQSQTTKVLIDELDEARTLLQRQEKEIQNLQETVNHLQEHQIQEECNRVEAEIAKERAINENRQLKIKNSELDEKIKAANKEATDLKIQREKTLLDLAQLENEIETKKYTATSIVKQKTATAEITDNKNSFQKATVQPVKGNLISIGFNRIATIEDFSGQNLTIDPNTSLPDINALRNKTRPSEFSPIKSEDEIESESDFSGADDEQTVVTLTPGGRRIKPTIKLPRTPERNGLFSNLWTRLDSHGRIINLAIRPMLNILTLLNSDNVPNHIKESYKAIEAPRSEFGTSVKVSKSRSNHRQFARKIKSRNSNF